MTSFLSSIAMQVTVRETDLTLLNRIFSYSLVSFLFTNNPAILVLTDFARFRIQTFCMILPDSARSCKILQGSVRCCKMLQDSARFCNILQDSARFCKILQDSAKFCKILQDSARFCKSESLNYM